MLPLVVFFLKRASKLFISVLTPQTSPVQESRAVARKQHDDALTAHARNRHISTSGLKSNITTVFSDPDFL